MASDPPSQDPYPDGWTVGDQVRAVLNAGADIHELADEEGIAKAGQAYSALMYDLYPLIQHPSPAVRDSVVEFLINNIHDSQRREAGQPALAGALHSSFRRGSGALWDTISPVSAQTLGEDYGDRVAGVRSLAEFLNSRFQPLTKGFWNAEEAYKRDIVTKHSFMMLPANEWYMDPEAANAPFAFDKADMRYNAEVAQGDLLTAENGTQYVDTSKGKYQVPTTITGPDGVAVSLKDRAGSITRAMRGVDPRGMGDVLGDRGIIGSIWYDYGSETVEGYDRNIKVGNGEIWPFVPNITGDFDFDRAQLMNPVFRRALSEASQETGFWTRASLNAGAMLQELTEYIGAAGVVGKVGKLGKRVFMGKASLTQFSNAKKLIPDKIVKPVAVGTGAATALGRAGVKNGIPAWMTWGWRDAANEMVLAYGQVFAEGGTMNEGTLRGFNEIVLERTFAVAGRVPVWIGGRVMGKALGERMAFFRNARIRRGTEHTEAMNRHRSRTLKDTGLIEKELTEIYRDRAMADWGIAIYDTGFMAMGLASQQVAIEQAQREGVDWQNLSLEAKAKRILAAVNNSWPEALGNWSAMMGGAAPALAKQMGGIKGLWNLNSPDGQRLAAQLRAIAELSKNGFLDSDVQGIKDIIILTDRKISALEAESLIEERARHQKEDTPDPPDDVDLLRVMKASMEHLMATEGLGFNEAHEAAFTEIVEVGASENRGRLQQLEVGTGGINERLVEAAKTYTIVPLGPGGRAPTYVDPKTGVVHTGASIHDVDLGLPETFDQVAEDAGWDENTRNAIGNGLREGDREATDLYELTRTNLQEGLEVPEFDYTPPPPLVGLRLPQLEADQKKAKETALELALLDTGASPRVARSKTFREPWEAAIDGAPEDVVVPEMAHKIAALHKAKLDEPVQALGDLTPRQVASEAFRQLTPQDFKATRVDRMVQMVEARITADQIHGVDTTDATVASLTFQAAGLRDSVLSLLIDLPGLRGLQRNSAEADGLMAALVNRNAQLRTLFESEWGARGVKAWEDAAQLAADVVRLSQEATLHMASHWPAQYRRLRMIYRANEMLNTSGKLPKWMLRRMRKLRLLEETPDGYALHPGAVEAQVGEVQLWARVFEESVHGHDLHALLGSYDVTRAVTGWAYGDKPIPTAMLERVLAEVPGARGEEFMSAWERLVTHLHPKNWPAGLTSWMPWKTEVLRVGNKLGRAYGTGRTAEAARGAEAAIRVNQLTTANFLEVRDQMTQISRLMSDYLERPGVTRDHSRFLTMMIHKGVFRLVRNKQDFVRRFEDLVGKNAGALYEIGVQYVTLTDQQGQRLVDLGMLKPEQFQKWRSRYVHRPILETDPFLYSESQRVGKNDDWQQLDQLLSRVSFEPSALRLLDFTLIAPLGVMREASTTRLVETLYQMWNSDQMIMVRRGEVPEGSLKRDYINLVDHGQLPEDFPFATNFVSKGMFSLLQQLRMNMEPAMQGVGDLMTKVPDGELMKAEKKKRGVPPGNWLGLGSSDPSSPWFENTPIEPQRNEDGTINPESHGNAYPRTPQFSEFLDSLLEHEKAPNGDLIPAWYVDTNTMEMIHQMVNDVYRDVTPFQRSVQETVMVFRRMKTLYSPKHWIKNFTSSLVLNWTAGGVSPVDFVKGMLFKTGDHYEANRLLGVWKDSHNPDNLARYEGDRKKMLESWTPKDRHDLRVVEEYLALSGGTTLTGAVLDPVTTENLVDSMIQGEVRIEDLLPESNGSSRAFDLLNRQLQRYTKERSYAAQAQALMFKSKAREEMAKALHSVVTEYASVEHFFKLAQALHLRRTRNLKLDDAIRLGARGTADYAGVSQVVNDLTSNWHGFRGAEAPGFKRAKDNLDKTLLGATADAAQTFGRFYFANVFWMFNAGALPTQFWGAVTHPHRALAGTAFASLAVYGIMKALQTDDEEERVREALLEMYGMEQWSLLSEKELNDILDSLGSLTGGASVSFTGGEYRDEVVSVLRRLLSTQPFRGVSIPRGGRSRTFTTEDVAPIAVAMALNTAGDIGSLVRGNYPEGYEMKAFMQGFLPAMVTGSLGAFHDLVKNHRGETPMEHGVRFVLDMSRTFGAALHPVAILGAPELVRVAEATMGRSIYDLTRGIRTPEWEEMSFGSRAMDVVISEVFPTRSVQSRAKDVDEREVLMLQRIVENLLPDLKSNVQGTEAEKLLSRAMRNSLEQTVKFLRDAIYDHYHLNSALDQGKAIGFDEILWQKFGVTRDMDFRNPDPMIGSWAMTDMGRFIRSAYGESELYGWMVQQAATRMARDYVFGSSRFYPLLELARRRLVDPAVAERLIKGLMDSSGSDTAKLLYARVVEGEPGKNLRAYYAVFRTLDFKKIRGFLGQRQTRELYEVFAAHDMLGDPWGPSAEELSSALGTRMFDLRPVESIRALEKR